MVSPITKRRKKKKNSTKQNCVAFFVLVVLLLHWWLIFSSVELTNKEVILLTTIRSGFGRWQQTLSRHECFTGKYNISKIRTRLHLWPEWLIFHILTSENIYDIIHPFFYDYSCWQSVCLHNKTKITRWLQDTPATVFFPRFHATV